MLLDRVLGKLAQGCSRGFISSRALFTSKRNILESEIVCPLMKLIRLAYQRGAEHADTSHRIMIPKVAL